MSCLDLSFEIDHKVVEALSKQLAFMNFAEPAILHIRLVLCAGADPQPIEALAEEEL